MRREYRERFPRHRGLAIPTCITARASRTRRDVCRDRWLAVSFEVGGEEYVSGIPGACATHNFTYLVRGPQHNTTKRVYPFLRKYCTWLLKQILVIDGWVIFCEIALIWMSLDFTYDQSALGAVMAWCRQATSHYLNHCWPRSPTPYVVTRPQSVN